MKKELPPAYASEAKPYGSLVPIVERLLRSGNSLTYPDRQTEHKGFMPTQGGWTCYLNKPIDFDLVTDSFDLPVKVHLSRDKDTIFDERTWVAIEGPGPVH